MLNVFFLQKSPVGLILIKTPKILVNLLLFAKKTYNFLTCFYKAMWNQFRMLISFITRDSNFGHVKVENTENVTYHCFHDL